MAEKTRIAIVGTNIGCTLHVRALRAAGFEVTALVGRDAERTQSRADHFGIPAALTSVDAAIDSDIDAIVIATPPASHHPMTMQALAAGKHVLCEKPLALDAGEAREMRDAAEEAGLVHQVVHPQRWAASHATARKLLRDGTLGTPLQAAFTFDHAMLADGLAGMPDWWTHRATGGGWLRNWNAHGIDLIRFVAGEFRAVSGRVHADASRGMTADDGYVAHFLLDGDIQGTMSGSCRARGFYMESRVIGSDATMRFDWASLSLIDKEGGRSVETPADVAAALRAGGAEIGAPEEPLPEAGTLYEAIHSSDHGFAEEVGLSRAFHNKIRDRGYRHPSIADFSDGVRHMEVIEAVERSDAEGRWIDLPS
jgi:predicted dehydrogenase